MWQLTIRSKIILVLLFTGLACLAAGGIIGYRAGEAALMQSVEGERVRILRDFLLEERSFLVGAQRVR